MPLCCLQSRRNRDAPFLEHQPDLEVPAASTDHTPNSIQEHGETVIAQAVA